MKNLTNYEKFLLVRELPKQFNTDILGIPVMPKQNSNSLPSNINFTSLSNINSIKDKTNTVVTSFQYDKTLLRYWNDPARYISKFKDFYYVATPDFSCYTNMSEIQIANNTYMNRWLGCFWSYFGIKTIPTISWAKENTYKYSFSGVEKGSIVIISTIGNYKNQELFMDGYNAMLKAIEPQMIFVKGALFEKMEGRIIQIPFESTFSTMIKEDK